MRAAVVVGLSALGIATACGNSVEDRRPLNAEAGSGGDPNPTVGSIAVATSVTSSVSTTVTTVGVGGSAQGGGPPVEPDGGAPPIPPLVEQDLGVVDLDSPVTFDIPPNTLGFTTVARVEGELVEVGVKTLTAPNGQTMIADFGQAEMMYGYTWWGMEAAQMPNSDRPEALPPMPGQWTVELWAATEATTAELSVWYRQTLDGDFHGGRIDVNIYNAASVQPAYLDSVVHGALDGFAGLYVGTITHHDLDDSYAVIDEENWLDVFSETDGAEGIPALNVLVTDYITFGPIGYASGIPALHTEHGTPKSGVVLMVNDAQLDPFVLRHEVGHSAGLFHTTEITPGFADQLADTPVCSNLEQAPWDCPDIDYLMFPYADYGSPSLMSPDQIRLVQGSTLYRGAVEPNGGFADPLDAADDASDSMAIFLDQAHGHRGHAHAVVHQRSATTGWRASFEPDVVRFVTGFWCQRSHGAELFAELTSPAALEALALASDAPDYVRMRALAALAIHGTEHPTFTMLARATTAPPRVRTAALDALWRTSPAAARTLAAEVRAASSSPAVLARFAARVR